MAMRAAAFLLGIAARKAFHASIPHYPHRSLQHVFVCVNRDTNHRHLSFVSNAGVDTFKERQILRCRGVPFRRCSCATA